MIPDFSCCGYGGGGVPLPTAKDVPAVITLSPVEGDNREQIQAAIDKVSAMQAQYAGHFKGAVRLNAGTYELSGKKAITIASSGVILRGAGDSEKGTVFKITGGATEAIVVAGTGSLSVDMSTKYTMTAAYVPCGANWFALDTTAGLAVGTRLQIIRPGNQAWIEAIGMADHWKPKNFEVKWDRTIVEIANDPPRVRLNSPITQACEAQYGGGYCYRITKSTMTEYVGVEGIRAFSTLDANELGNTGGTLFTISDIENGFFRNCTNHNMRGHTTKIGGSRFVTLEDITSEHTPLGTGHSGASIQINTTGGCQFVLFHRFTTGDAGFEFSSGGHDAGPNAIVECSIPHGFAFAGPHMDWSLATLYDNCKFNLGLAVIKNNSSHGWAGANQVAWNTTSSGFRFERPPTAHQWLIGCTGPLQASKGGTGSPEVISPNKEVSPLSLYRAQLEARVGVAAANAALGPPHVGRQ